MKSQITITYDLNKLADKWPSGLVAREKISDFSGGILHPRRMANLDCLGEGPERIRIGRKIAYPVDALVEWMKSRETAL